jgi:acyl-CoA synthetase (AMP-forming)/AMP-acid ligase II
MKGLMQDWPLLTTQVLTHAARWHCEREVVARDLDGHIHRQTYAQLDQRARQCASSLSAKLGVKNGDIIGTLAHTTMRHLEVWHAIMGLGAVAHTINPRLFEDQIAYIINHAEDQWIFVEPSFIPILERMQQKLPGVRGYIVLCGRADMPATSLRSLHCYEDLFADADENFEWPIFDENTACGLCYTSGTTGNPKGVLYSHRSQMLHALIVSIGDANPRTSQDRLLPLSPLYHVSAWGTPFMALMCGADLILPGSRFDGASVYELLETERVTEIVSVPTILGLLQAFLTENPGLRLNHLKMIRIGGSALPPSQHTYFTQVQGIIVRHGFGMTETSPVGTTSNPKGELNGPVPATIELAQGRPLFGFDMKIVDEQGAGIPHDSKQHGLLKVRGPAVARSYFKGESASSFDVDGWFTTGDIGTIDESGSLRITDRAKDLIKSGGEWISSIDLENIAMGCEGVAQAAAIGLPHPKWDERPLLIVVRSADSQVSGAEILDYMRGKIVKWWMPDAVVFENSLPMTGTGKISKLKLREKFKGYSFPN